LIVGFLEYDGVGTTLGTFVAINGVPVTGDLVGFEVGLTVTIYVEAEVGRIVSLIEGRVLGDTDGFIEGLFVGVFGPIVGSRDSKGEGGLLCLIVG
jgi:hypothetical protein